MLFIYLFFVRYWVKGVDFGLIPSPTSVSSLFGRRFEGYKLNSPPLLLNIPICNIFSHNNKSELFLLWSEIRLNRPNSVNNFRVCFFLFISFIIPLYLFNIICRVALLEFYFSGKITRFSQHNRSSRVRMNPLYIRLHCP